LREQLEHRNPRRDPARRPDLAALGDSDLTEVAMNIQSETAHRSPLVEIRRERDGTHDKDGFVLSAHRGKSQGRPRTTPSSRLISHIGLPDRVSQQSPLSPRNRSLTAGPDTVSSPDNAFSYVKNRSLRELLERRSIKHLRTQAYRPRTNGKAERFIRTLVEGWAYNAIYGSSAERTNALPAWLERYNWRRSHRGIDRRTPMQRLAEINNLVRAHS